MRGEFIGVWPETWAAIWGPLTELEGTPSAIFCDLYRELTNAFSEPPRIESLADIIDDFEQSLQAFRDSDASQFKNEKALVRFFESAFEILEDVEDELGGRYFNLLNSFVEKYNLGYSLRRPCALSPTLPGIFADLSNALKQLALTDVHLTELHHAHEEAVRDLRFGATEERMKTCISRQFMLLEAIAASTGNATANTLGGMCDQLTSWPHTTIKESLKKLYGFASDYPGIRHAGNPSSRLKPIDTRDLAAVSIVLTGYSAYLTNALETSLASLMDE